MSETRIEQRFAALKKEGRPAFVTFVTAGDPDLDTSLQIIKSLPEVGADIIEIGMPFSDPMADGPAIQLAGQRALKGGHNSQRTMDMVREFRKDDDETPIVLMGYYNPIYIYGNEKFLSDAKEAGVDGLIIVDLPPEADDELCIPAIRHGLNFIRLAAPTTDEKRLPVVLNNTSGFVYYVSITGITGTATPDPEIVADAIRHIKAKTELPVVVGFGVKTAEHVKAFGRVSDGVVVGSAIVSSIQSSLDEKGKATIRTVSAVRNLVSELSTGVKLAKM